MLEAMVMEADIDKIAVPDGYDVLDATALGQRLGLKRDTVLAYLSRRNFGRIPKPNRKLAMGPVWFERTVEEWEKRSKDG
jgi:predicted DNA-binding transcriptional regulator AlpA